TSSYPAAIDLTGIDLAEAFDGGTAAGTVIKAVKEQLRALPDNGVGYGLLRHLGTDTAAALTGFPAPQLSFDYVDRAAIDACALTYPELTDIWPLSPLQHGMLFHAIYDTESADAYTVQSRLTLSGRVDTTRLRTAAQLLVSRHENLRAAFVETGDGPLQV